jgi:uncharacterized protein (TIGR00369 family)
MTGSILPDGRTISSEDITGMTGLEVMQAVSDGRLPPAPIADVMGFRLVAVTPGEAVFEGTPSPAFRNPMGAIHGGWYGTLLDSALGCAVHTMMPEGAAYTTLEYKVNITRALRPGTTVRCVGKTSHVGRSTALAEARIEGIEDGKLSATGSTTCIILSTGRGD